MEGFDFFIGGGVGSTSAIAHRIGYRAPEYGVADALARVFDIYLREREPQETFRVWAARAGDAEVKRALAGVDPAGMPDVSRVEPYGSRSSCRF